VPRYTFQFEIFFSTIYTTKFKAALLWINPYFSADKHEILGIWGYCSLFICIQLSYTGLTLVNLCHRSVILLNDMRFCGIPMLVSKIPTKRGVYLKACIHLPSFLHMAITLSHNLDAMAPFLKFKCLRLKISGIFFLLWWTVPQEFTIL
jgi:hypothetical protein